MRHSLAALFIAVALSACTLMRPASFPPAPAPSAPSAGGTAQPAPGTTAPGEAAPGNVATPTPSEPVPAPPPKQFHLSPAATALVAQAHTQAGGGEFGQAAATLERAMRIEPDNPLLWVELGRVRLSENNPAQADAMGRKALSLATGDAAAQASAWHLIGESLRARGRNGEAAEADEHAQGLSVR